MLASLIYLLSSIYTDIAAYPDSVNVLNPNQQTDVRTPDKLIDGINDTNDGAHMWLAPVLPSIVSVICHLATRVIVGICNTELFIKF